MTLYEQILELFPLASYEQNRRENGHVGGLLHGGDGLFSGGAGIVPCPFP